MRFNKDKWFKRPKTKSKFEFLRMLKEEIYDSIISHPFKIIRFLGILFIPFLYGFVYIFAFNDPLSKTNKLDFALIMPNDKSTSQVESLISKIKKNQEKDVNITPVKMEAEDIYKKTNKFNQEVEKHYLSIVLTMPQKNGKKLSLNEYLINQLQTFLKNPGQKPEDVINNFTDSFRKDKIVQLYFNNKKNFLISFGASMKMATTTVYEKIIKSFVDLDDNTLTKLFPTITNQQLLFVKPLLQKTKDLASKLGEFKLMKTKSQMEQHAKYGFGLAPFFIALSLWVGALATSLFINGRVHRKKENKLKLYFVKLFIASTASVTQTSILFLSLITIGFYNLGPPLAFMYFTALISALIFTSIIISIRFMIPSRVAGIITVVFLLILQMASSGGLFPQFAQSHLIQGISKVMPLKYAIDSLRDSMFEINGLKWFLNMLVLFTLSVTFQVAGPLIYSHRKNKEYPIQKAVKHVKHN